MKKSTLLLAAFVSLTIPTLSFADTPAAKKKASQTAKTTTTTAPKTAERTVYYITEAHTGSNIPTVYRSYNGRIDSASSPAVYGSERISQTGSLDVSTALYKLDTSITLGRRR